jgi:hypothetical protein
MMKKLLLLIASVLIMISIVERLQSDTGQKQKLRLSLKKSDIVDQIKVGYNNWGYQMQNQGVYMLDARNGSAGGEFPRGSGETVMYSGGFDVIGVDTTRDLGFTYNDNDY